MFFELAAVLVAGYLVIVCLFVVCLSVTIVYCGQRVRDTHLVAIDQ